MGTSWLSRKSALNRALVPVFAGILFYRHSFSGLRKYRRILLHTLIFLLLIGTNLLAYSMVDADW